AATARDGTYVEWTGCIGNGALRRDDAAAFFDELLHVADEVEVGLKAFLVFASHLAGQRLVGAAHRVHDRCAPALLSLYRRIGRRLGSGGNTGEQAGEGGARIL